MKNYLKTYAKKSVSLFLAVLMVLSCWVWMAPAEKLEASAGSDDSTVTPLTQYTVKINVTFTNPCDGGHVKNNGTTVIESFPSSFKANGNQTLTYTTTDFPTEIFIRFATNRLSTSKGEITSISINGYTVQSGGWSLDRTAVGAKNDDYTFTRTSDTSSNMGGTVKWPLPEIVGFDSSTVADNDSDSDTDVNIALNKIGGADATGSAKFTMGTFFDQYGVKWTSGTQTFGKITKSTYISDTSDGNAIDESKGSEYLTLASTDTNTTSSGTVTANPGFQQKITVDAKNGYKEYYLFHKWEGTDWTGGTITSKTSTKIRINYPKYTVNFNGGISSAAIKDASGNVLGTGTYSVSGYYGQTISVPAFDKSTADGYTFYGFWSKQQPATGDANYNAASADFAKPCTEADYISYGGEKGGTDIITDKDDQKWYNAGEKLDPAAAKSLSLPDGATSIKENWYGWWLSKDLIVQFYDVDGKFLGRKNVKSGQTQSAITWPVSSYSTYKQGAVEAKVVAGTWVDMEGNIVTANSHVFTKDLILTPYIDRSQTTMQKEYPVTFVNPNGGIVNQYQSGKDNPNVYDYRLDIKTYAENAFNTIKALGDPNDLSTAESTEFRYELLGWSSVVPTTGKNYHVLKEGTGFDFKNTAIGLNSDWVVRGDATYYPVYESQTKTYAVRFNYKDATGADVHRDVKVKYRENLVAPTAYVPYKYVTKGFGYTFKQWSYQNATKTFTYNASVPFTLEYFNIPGSALAGEGAKPIEITAVYGDKEATPYTVTFNYVDGTQPYVVEVKNEEFILEATVESLDPAAEWENEDKLYKYLGQWEITEGSATTESGVEYEVGDKIKTEDLITLSPTSNLTFKPVYGDAKAYYTVTYIDGTNTFTKRVLQGSDVPAWTYPVIVDDKGNDDPEDDVIENKLYVPENKDVDGGKNEFQGWFDEKQIANDKTNGREYTTNDKVESNLTLYSQFKFVPNKYRIAFMNHDGTVPLGEGDYEKGQNIEALVLRAQRGAIARDDDAEYEYEFIGWDKEVPTVCEGYDVTYTALYKTRYRYYDIKWYNSNPVYKTNDAGEFILDDNGNKIIVGWVADKTTDAAGAETNLLGTTHHTYNSKIYTPAVGAINCLETAPEGKSYVFAGWYYNDAEGNAVKYDRNMKVTKEMEFYATFTETALSYKVTTVVKGESETYELASDAKISETISDPNSGYLDADYHDEFVAWYTDATYTNEFTADTVTADTTLYAKFIKSEHNRTEKEHVSDPSYEAEGKDFIWCSCNRKETEQTVTLPKLQDTKAPTGTIYLGEHSWSSTDEKGANETDNDEVSIYANADTNIIITANDTGDVDAIYNPSGKGSGVKVIRAFAFPANTVLTATNYGAAQKVAIDVYNAPVDEDGNYTSETTNANFAIKLGDMEVAVLENDNPVYDENGEIERQPLQSGETYIVYYYVNDKATTDNGAAADTGNQLNRKVRTAKFVYDSTKPVFTVEGESDDKAVPTYCGTATVTGIEAGTTLKVNNAEVEVTADGKYVINYADGMDNVFIVATDIAGNTFSKSIKVADHAYVTTEKSASCGVEGYKKVECITCGDVKSEETYPALAHAYTGRQVIPADCVNNGKVVVTCEICGDSVTTEFEEDGVTPVIPVLGHEYAKDEKGEIIYTTVTESTCTVKGLGEAYCTVCGDGRITTELELDEDNHVEYESDDKAATCTEPGYEKTICAACKDVIEEKTIDALGHGSVEAGTAEWVVTLAPTCYQEGSQKLVCKNSGCQEVLDTEVIKATGEHVKTVTNPGSYKTDGYVYYHCATEGCPFEYTPKEYIDDSLEEYTVTFETEDGNEIIKTIEVLEGEQIDKGAVTAPAKANSADGMYKYSFAGWVEVITNEDGTTTDGDTYKLPLAPKKNLVLKASYNATKIMYTHQFEVDGKVVKELVGGMGDVVKYSAVPTYKAKGADDANYTWAFKGWKNSAGLIEEEFIITSDRTFVAEFTSTPIKYSVVYYNGDEPIWSTEVNKGSAAVYENYVKNEDGVDGLVEPTKAKDDKNHYSFAGWYTDKACTNAYAGAKITEITRLYAGFTATEHTYDVDTTKGSVVDEANPEVKDGIVQKQTCVLDEKVAMICSEEDCKHETEVVTENTATGHDEYKKDVNGNYVYENGNKVLNSTLEKAEDGKTYTVVRCSNCGEERYREQASYEVVFKVNGLPVLTRDVLYGAVIGDYEGTPEKDSTAQYIYTFAGWYVDGDTTETVINLTNTIVTANMVLVAKFNKTTQVYKVSYLRYTDEIAIQTYFEVEYGSKLPAFTGDTTDLANIIGADYKGVYAEGGHYVFDTWDKDADYIVKDDTTVRPVLKLVDHSLSEVESKPTCTEAGGLVTVCEYCNYRANATVPALGHDWATSKITTEPNYETQQPGLRTYYCSRCEETKTEEVPGDRFSIKATVKDANGNPTAGVMVELLMKQEDGAYVKIHQKETDTNGVVIFSKLPNGEYLAPGEYRVYVTSTGTHSDVTIKENGKVVGGDIEIKPENKPVDDSCKCSCHKDNFWGIIYRLIQKIIKFFAGKPSCCADPDSRI